VEKTITLGKKGTLHAKRLARKVVIEKDAFLKLFGPLSERYAQRNGGYTRIIKIGNRLGDDAPMAFIELVDREGEAPAPKEKAGKKADKKAEAKPDKDKKAAKKTDTKKKPAEAKKEDKKKAETKKSATTTKKAATKKAAPKNKKSGGKK